MMLDLIFLFRTYILTIAAVSDEGEKKEKKKKEKEKERERTSKACDRRRRCCAHRHHVNARTHESP